VLLLSLLVAHLGSGLISLVHVLLLLLLFVVSHLLQSEEVLTRLFVQLTVNPVDDVENPGDLNELQGVHSSVGHFEGIIQGHELGLEGSDCNEHFQESTEGFTGALDSLTTTRQTQQRRTFFKLILSSQREDGQLNTGDVLSVHVKAHVSSLLDVVDDIAGNITSSEVSGGETERSLLEILTHAHFSLDNLLEDSAESFLEGVGLLLEQLETFLSTDSLDLVELQIPKFSIRYFESKIHTFWRAKLMSFLEFYYNLELSKVTVYISKTPSEVPALPNPASSPHVH